MSVRIPEEKKEPLGIIFTTQQLQHEYQERRVLSRRHQSTGYNQT